MQFALMILPYHRKSLRCGRTTIADPHLGAWRAYYKALVEAGVLRRRQCLLKCPETGTTVRLKDGKRRVQGWALRGDEGATGRIHHPGLPSIDAALGMGLRDARGIDRRSGSPPLAPEAMRRGFTG